MNTKIPPPNSKTIADIISPDELNFLNKMSYLSRRAAAARQAVSFLQYEHHKRILSRAVYLQVDSFIYFGRRLKNSLFRSSTIKVEVRDLLEIHLKKLNSDYQKIYEAIRDKLSAHRQEENLDSIIDHWNSIDLLSIDIFVDDMIHIMSILSGPLFFRWQSPDPAEISPIIEVFQKGLSVNLGKPNMSTDSLALTRGNTLGIVACHPDQEKAMALSSLIDLIEMLADLAQHSHKSEILHEVVWSLIVVDAFSFIDNLYDDSRYESLLKKWMNGQYRGYLTLNAAAMGRDLALEAEAKKVRNKFAAHIDLKMPYQDIKKLASDCDLKKFLIYLGGHIESFQKACAQDVRTTMFNVRNVPLSEVSTVETKAVKKFD